MGLAHAPHPWVGYWTPQGVWVDSPTPAYGHPYPWEPGGSADPSTRPSIPWAWLVPLGLILVGGAFLAAGVAKRLG